MENHQSEFAALSAYSTARWNKKCKELHSNSISVVCPFWIRQTTNHLPPIHSFIKLSICTKKHQSDAVTHTFLCILPAMHKLEFALWTLCLIICSDVVSGELTPQGWTVSTYLILCYLVCFACSSLSVVSMCLVLVIFPLTKCKRIIILSWG